MLVGVISDGKIYQLVGGVTNAHWVELQTGGGSVATGTGGIIAGGRRISNDTSIIDGARRV
jgi:hypothetical protein